MRRKIRFLNAGVAIFCAIFFVFSSIAIAAQTRLQKNQGNEQSADDFWRITPHSALIYAGFPIIAQLKGAPYLPVHITDWSGKPFPRPTIMWIGSGIGLRPGLPIYLLLFASEMGRIKVDIYSDGILYSSVPGINGLIIVIYIEKGFHHLKFVPEGFEEETLELDVQIGFNGFTEHILPYLN